MMELCGKPVRMVGKITSGRFTYCTLPGGHAGNCDDQITREERAAPDAEEGWLLSGAHPDDADEQSSDPFLPTYVPEIPDGVVIQWVQ